MDKPIRILHVFNSLNQGGIQNLIINVYRKIDKNKIQFDFLMNEDGYFDDEIKALGGRVYKIPALNKVGQLKYTKELTNFFNEHKEYKIVHSHYNQISGIILEIAKKCNIPIRIAHSHASNNINNIVTKLYKLYLQSKIKKNATHFFACSRKAGEWLFKSKADNMVIINNGINMEDFFYSGEKRKKIRKELNINDDTMVIGHVGRFSKVKNHDFLVEIFNEYQKVNSNSILLLVGTGQLECNIREKVKKLNLNDKVKFLGVRKDTDYLYSAFDCFVFPSLYEGLGITLIEAQASGLKTITSANDIPIETKITDLIEYINLNEVPEKWAERISINSNREEINNDLINSNFNIKNTVEQLEKFYEEVI